MIRKLLFIAGFLCILGISSTRAQAPVADFSASVTSGCGPLTVAFKDNSTNSPTAWQWDFGNGQGSTQQNPVAIYGAPGTYTVVLIVRNHNGGDAIRKTDYITVFPSPVTKFTSNVTIACTPANVQFTDLSTPGQGNITGWSWDLGDGTGSSQQNPLHVYNQTGYYNITLKVTNSGGCSFSSTYNRYLRVVDGIQPNFTWNQASASCSAPFILNFVNQTAGPGNLTYSWNLGNGANPAASGDTSPTNITYPSTGSYNVTLQVSSNLGCTGTLTQTVPLTNNSATITGPDNTCVNTPVTFTDGSTPAPLSSQWDFGDGTTSSDLNPSKSYTANGSYTVKVTNQYASCTTTAAKTIQVGSPPVPVFTADKTVSCSAPLQVQFTDQTNPVPTQWFWDFGDGQTSTAQNPVHTYTMTGIFDVKLTTTSGGCSGTTTMSQYIKVQPPVINGLAGTLSACINTTPDHTAVTPVADITAPDGIASWSWSAPGATPSTSTAAFPSFTYATTGNESISLTVTTNGGCQVSRTFTNAVEIGTPTPASISTSPAPVPPGNSFCGRNMITFSDPATPANEYRWHWQLGDGTIVDSNGPDVSHSYFNIATKIVKLDLIHNGCPQSTQLVIRINPPIVAWNFIADCAKGNPYNVTFTDTSYEYGPPANFSATWDYGDGSPTQSIGTINSQVTHTYIPPNPGGLNYYNVTLTATDDFCTQTLTKTIALGHVPISFNIDPLICSGVFFQVKANSPNPNLIKGYYWHWEYNQGPYSFVPVDTATLQSLVRGLHTLTLVVQLASGCLDSISHPVRISYPDPLFTMPAGGCANSPISFTDASTPDPATGSQITYWAWDFGDPTPPFLVQNPTHSYKDSGYYGVRLTVRDANNCLRIYANPNLLHITNPIARFSGPDSFYCPKTNLVFKDSSMGFNLIKNWTYGDGSPNDATGQHSYAANGTYPVTLLVTDRFACTSTLTKPVRIQSPIAAFDIADTTAICTPLQTQFTSRGQFYDSLYWDFGDGSTSTLPVTSHFYNSFDIFNAKLFLRGPGGCFDSATRRVMVLDPVKTSKFRYSPLSACDSVPVQFDLAPTPYTNFTLVFGDNTADSSQNPKPFHMYRSPNVYTPSLVLTDATGCIVNVGAALGPVKVLGSLPFITLNPHAFCDSGFVTFTDYTYTNDGIVNETLNFGDGSPPQTHATGTADFNTDHYYNKPGTYLTTLRVSTNSSCTESYTDTVRVHPTPHPVITVTSPLCTGIITFDGSTFNAITEPVLWAWDFGNGEKATAQNTSADYKPGSYRVQLQTSIPFGCKDTTSVAIVINPHPEIKGPNEINTPVGYPVTIPFTYSSNVTTWVWTPADSLSCADCANPSTTLVFKKFFRVTVTDVNNCMASDSILVKTICNDKNYFFPNTFSPNGDGVNDYFFPRGSNLFNIQSLMVFNRWGQKVFERRDFPANNPTLGWDGTINGRPAPVDAYIYIAEVVCNNAEVVSLHGDVSLIR